MDLMAARRQLTKMGRRAAQPCSLRCVEVSKKDPPKAAFPARTCQGLRLDRDASLAPAAPGHIAEAREAGQHHSIIPMSTARGQVGHLL